MHPLALIDTHTHFDVPEFDADRLTLAQQAHASGVQALLLIGFVASRFDELIATQQQINSSPQPHPQALLAPGLHPFYIQQHTQDHLLQLEGILKTRPTVAVAEIGLDTFTVEMKQPEVFAKQQAFFAAQLELAKQFQLPVLLHIRRSHAEALAILKQHKFPYGGIAHSFGGGVEEAKAFAKLGFKLGVTGQITNPNAKRLHQVVQAMGAEHLVLETDCPDMTPLCCQIVDKLGGQQRTRNTPANLPYVLDGLYASLNADRLTGLSEAQKTAEKAALAQQIWQNSCLALHLDWAYPHADH